MNLDDRIEALSALGIEISSKPMWLEDKVASAYIENKWFTPENSWKGLNAIADKFLEKAILRKWVSDYKIVDKQEIKKIGLVLAGNIPLVGFHDVLSTFISGHKSIIKCSSKDSILLKAIIEHMVAQFPDSESYFEFTERLKGFDAVIATGSDNSARYFEQYFGQYPNIIRKNRNAVAVLDGTESKEDLMNLGQDIFIYFGLGCRNVSKLYVPEGYKFDNLLEVLHGGYKELANHNKYRNNFDYNNALFLLNRVDFLMSGSLIITASEEITSRIATLHYEQYKDKSELAQHLNEVKDKIQCIVSKSPLQGFDSFKFGEAQEPAITDYADGVDTLAFLKSLG